MKKEEECCRQRHKHLRHPRRKRDLKMVFRNTILQYNLNIEYKIVQKRVMRYATIRFISSFIEQAEAAGVNKGSM